LAFILALASIGCESRVTLEVQFILPEKLQPLDVGRLAVRSEEEHSSYEDVPVPEPGPDRGDGCGPFLISANGFTVRCTYVGNASRSILSAWYDTDKSGNMTRGDFTGSSKATVVRAPLLKLSGQGQAQDVVMTEVTTGPPAKPPSTP
jgi:hypothetical protein